jgi:hypothetical protein
MGMVARLQHNKPFNPGGPTLKGHEVLLRALEELGKGIHLLFLWPWEEADIEKLKRIVWHIGINTESP